MALKLIDTTIISVRISIMNNFVDEIRDSIEISVVNGSAVVVSTMSHIEQGLRIFSLAMAIVYTACRLYDWWLKRKDDKKK